jgi:hypothetical protein
MFGLFLNIFILRRENKIHLFFINQTMPRATK